MKTLILGTCYISAGTEGAQNYKGDLVRLWLDVMLKLNPECDILIVDAHSPVDVFATLGGPREDGSRATVTVLDENIGHLNVSGRDGWGRAMSVGIQHAIDRRYEMLVYVDADIILARPVMPIIEKMARSGVKAAAPMDCMYRFLENGIMFLDVEYLRESRFVERYDWQNRTRSADPLEIPEMVCERLLEDVLFTLPLRTYRDDTNRLSVNNLAHMFPYGLDALTHVRDMAVYHRFIEMKGIQL